MPASVLLDADTIAGIVARLGAEIEADHPDGVVLIAVLKGALLFAADLSRAIREVPVEVEFMSISRFAPDSGRVRILHDVGTDIGGRDVVLVEDIVDTGLTLAYLTSQLALRAPRRLSTCALLDRPGPPHRPPGDQVPGGGTGRAVRPRVRTARARPVPQPAVRRRRATAPTWPMTAACYVPDLYRSDRTRRPVDRTQPPVERTRRGAGALEAGGSVTATPEARSEVL